MEPDFYGANTWTPYPFEGDYNEVTSAVVDAQITVAGALAGKAVLLTTLQWPTEGTPNVEITCEGAVRVSGAPIRAGFGDYEIWQMAGPDIQVTLVVARSGEGLNYTGTGYRFIPHVISDSPTSVVQAVISNGVEVASGTQTLGLEEGFNVGLSSTVRDGQVVLTVAAVAGAGRTGASGQPCLPPELNPDIGISSVNGVYPDQRGDLKVRGSGIWVTGHAVDGLRLLNVGKPCCDCEDYATLFARLGDTNTRLGVTRDWIINSQVRYRVLLDYVNSLLRHEITGGTGPGDTDKVASC